MIWLLLACHGQIGDARDWVGQLEADWDQDFSYRAQRTLGFRCTDEAGVEWLYVQAYSRSKNSDCKQEDSVTDQGETVQGSFAVSCAGIEQAYTQTQEAGTGVLGCGAGRVSSDRSYQLSMWFTEWDEQWPVDATFYSGSFTTCVGSQEEVPALGVQAASFTADPYSDELMVGGDLHGLLKVDYCN